MWRILIARCDFAWVKNPRYYEDFIRCIPTSE